MSESISAQYNSVLKALSGFISTQLISVSPKNPSPSQLPSVIPGCFQGFPKLLGFLNSDQIPCNVEMFGNTLTSISVFFLVAIATDRFIFIEYPMKYHGWIQRTYKWQIAAIWLGTTLLWSAMNFEMICAGLEHFIYYKKLTF